MNIYLPRIADAFPWSVTVAPSNIKHSSAGAGGFLARVFQKGKVIWNYYGMLVYQKLSSSRDTRKMYGSKVLKVDVARFSKYARQVQMQEKRFEWVTERLGKKNAVCVVSAFSCACGLINDFRYGKEY